MKRTLVLCLLCGLAVSSMAQTSSAPVKPANTQKTAPAKPAGASAQPSNVKVVAVPAAQAKPTAAVPKAAAKPAVIAVQPVAKPAVVAAKPATISAKPAVVSATPVPVQKNAAQSIKPAAPAKASTSVPVVAVKPLPQGSKTAAAAKGMASAKSGDPFNKKKVEARVQATSAVAKPTGKKPGAVVAVNENKPVAEKNPEPKKISAVEHRDPFVSPVVHIGAVGSGCSSGKRCLAIDQIALRGVVRSENGMIAVVVNAMDKAYFLRENDPVFNGYVTKITPDSIIFKETFHDKLGKEMTRDITKTISRPAA